MLSEDLAKQDTAFESSCNKLVDIIRSLLGAEAATKLAGSLSVNESKFSDWTWGDAQLDKEEREECSQRRRDKRDESFLVCLGVEFATMIVKGDFARKTCLLRTTTTATVSCSWGCDLVSICIFDDLLTLRQHPCSCIQ